MCVVFADVAKGNYPSSQDGRYVTIRVYCTDYSVIIIIITHNNIVLRDVVVVRVTTTEENNY